MRKVAGEKTIGCFTGGVTRSVATFRVALAKCREARKSRETEDELGIARIQF